MALDENKKSMQNVYDKMINEADENVKKERFYQYFYNLLETGNNYCTFTETKLFKSVDESWINAIEEAMQSLQTLVMNPRKYIEEDREIVNIAMARTITPESIQHLLQHSNMIDKINDDGTVIPNRILNVFKEESYQTYENRFIFTLILMLQEFINKRFNVIFETSKDEIGLFFEMESTIDNYTEIVDYKLEVKIREKQTDMNNEEENLEIFTRISKLHRQINDLAASGFMTIMRQYPVIRHPVVKTNAIGKNANYKACHKLWNYIYGYDRVGYKVNLVKQNPVISKQFEKDIYNSFIWDYTMLRTYGEEIDTLNIERPKRKKDITVKYIRQALDEIIDGIDMSDANLRKLIMNELTDLQLKKKAEKVNTKQAQNAKKLRKNRRVK